jgi:hypothetical protein
MNAKQQDPLIPFILEQFKRAAIVCDYGYEDEDNEMQIAGLKSARRAVQTLEALDADGRQFLAPLLDDPNPAVQVLAAAYLVKIMPERALAVLRHLRDYCLDQPRMTAARMLRNHDRGDLNL